MTCSSCLSYGQAFCRLWRVDKSPDSPVCGEFKEAEDRRSFEEVWRGKGYVVEVVEVRAP